MGIMALIFALFTDISSLVGIGVGIIISMIILMAYSKDNKPKVFLDDAERVLSYDGTAVSCCLSCLPAWEEFSTAAGVGDVISQIVSLLCAGRKCKCRNYCICSWHGGLHSYYGKRICGNYSTDSGYRSAFCAGIWSRSGGDRGGGSDYGILRNAF